jgi:hypothetical protein
MRLKLFTLQFILLSCGASAVLAEVNFEQEIRPLLQEHCVSCHGEKKQKADLRLDARSHAFKGGESGAAILPGQAEESLLYQRILATDDERMPPEGVGLTALQAEKVKAWIQAGAVWPESDYDRAAVADPRLQHWAFQPLKLPAAGRGVDDFITAGLKEKGLALSAPADGRTLVRRLYYSITGLPPSPQQMQAAQQQTTRSSISALIDSLLSSPRYGEKWARHWLDVVRFAESDGYEKNNHRPNAWPYRDYVIHALNEDKPYDQFIREQLAGDALGADAATGFLVGGAVDTVKSKDPVLTANQRADELHDMVSTTAATFLGLTLNCARCHDHKFDPLPTEDYYAFVATLQGVQHGERALRDTGPASQQREQQTAQLKRQLLQVEKQLSAYQPAAHLGRVVLLDDADATRTESLRQMSHAQPFLYSAGKEQGQADDPGDSVRLPQLGESYRYWRAMPGERLDCFLWKPALKGRFRLWLSWAVWTTHAADARYVLDADGDLQTRADQQELATVNQQFFADGKPAISQQKRWSGFQPVNQVLELNERSVILLRSGLKGGPTVAEMIALEELPRESLLSATVQQPPLRAPVTRQGMEDRFAPTRARFLRFSITDTNNGSEPCLDELEVFGTTISQPSAAAVNLARRAKLSSGGDYGPSAIHKLEHLTDGVYGNEHSWISRQKKGGWVQLQFSEPALLQSIRWSRDRSTSAGKHYEDRLATGYRVELSEDAQHWTLVAASGDRLPQRYAARIPSLPTLSKVPEDKAEAVNQLVQQRSAVALGLEKLTKLPMAYAGTFSQPGATHRMHRGDPTQPKEVIAPAALSQIGTALKMAADLPEQQRRLALADWIAQKGNPLTARVMVNRLWHYHFGTGLVDTPSDFGLNGSRPTHPELLDYLAYELITHGWSLKHIHRLILKSQTFQQDSAWNAAAAQVDSSARLLWRYPPRRLEAEALRDSILATSGLLDFKMGGPGFDLFEPNENYVKVYVTKAEYGPAEFRRMVYQSKPRTMLDDFFGAFDCPDAGQPQPKRTASTTPLQALNLLNSRFALQQARALAERLHREQPDEHQQIAHAYQLLYQRQPSEEEWREAAEFSQEHGLAALCRALYNSNEFIRLN